MNVPALTALKRALLKQYPYLTADALARLANGVERGAPGTDAALEYRQNHPEITSQPTVIPSPFNQKQPVVTIELDIPQHLTPQLSCKPAIY